MDACVSALRLASAHAARRKAAEGRALDNNKMMLIGVFLAAFGLYVYR